MEEEAPRGLVFDHGCDALNVIISACTFASTIKLEATYWVLGVLFYGVEVAHFNDVVFNFGVLVVVVVVAGD